MVRIGRSEQIDEQKRRPLTLLLLVDAWFQHFICRTPATAIHDFAIGRSALAKSQVRDLRDFLRLCSIDPPVVDQSPTVVHSLDVKRVWFSVDISKATPH